MESREPCGRDKRSSDLLHELDLEPARVAVELDRRIVKQAQWAGTILSPGARLEIVQFVGGG